MSSKLELIHGALKGVKAPGASADILSLNQIQNVDFHENSCVITLAISDVTTMIEKSLKYQIESALKKVSPTLSVIVKFNSPKTPSSRLSSIRSIIAVASGKGGVGKSSVTVNLAASFLRRGYRVGILDCDVYGPSIPTMMGVEDQKPLVVNQKMQPVEAHGIKIMSAGFFVEPGQSLVWRGPMIHKLIQQFANDVDWSGIDLLVVDLPPGTGDAALSLSQTLPLTGAVMVSTPQKISLIDVHKSVSMFQHLKVPILGMIENMSRYVCSHCDHSEAIFDQGRVEQFCKEMGIAYLGDLPIEPKVRAHCDEGKPFVLADSESKCAQRFFEIAATLEPFLQTPEQESKEFRFGA